MNPRRLISSLAAVAAFVASPADAALVQTTITSSSGSTASAVHDTTASLEWLSPRATVRLTISDVMAGAGAWVNDGFRYATAAELLALLQHAGIPALGTDPTQAEAWSDAATIAAAQTLVSGMGWTYENNAPSSGNPFGQREVYGVLADTFMGDGQTPTSRRYAWFGASDNRAYAYAVGAQWLYGAQDSLVGSFLVRDLVSPVPEPGVLALALPMLLLTLRSRCRS